MPPESRTTSTATTAPPVSLVCPGCRGKLRAGRGEKAGAWWCGACGPFPVVGGVPLLVVDVVDHAARHRDALLAALALAGRIDEAATAWIAGLAAVGAAGARVQQEPLPVDFTAEEARAAPPPPVAATTLQALVDEGLARGPLPWLAARLGLIPGDDAQTAWRLPGPRPRLVLDVGAGAGEATALLAAALHTDALHTDGLFPGPPAAGPSKAAGQKPRGRSLPTIIAADLSLPAALCVPPLPGVVAVVADATALPVPDGQVDLICALHLLDVLGDPAAFLAEAARTLRPGGCLLASTPEPALGTDDDETLFRLAQAHGFRLVERTDALVWPRVHGPRHVEVWVSAAAVWQRL
jgi:SAM-dependent methyltransferase/uncharacterized protein YbaR (Trm112 family)